MSVNRVQKLLFSEYCDFEDMVLIESPFAQTTKDGMGIRQVHLGLTPSKLVLATDVLPPVEYGNFKYIPGVDPEIETFELIAIYPVECVNLSIYRRRKRQALKARFCNNKVLYFELGGFEKRGMFWNLWCEKVKFLCPGESASSRSETSVATSTTGSTLYLLDRKLVAVNGVRQLWCKFGPNGIFDTNLVRDVIGNSQVSLVSKWIDRYLYLGPNFNEVTTMYEPVVNRPTVDEFVTRKPVTSRSVLTTNNIRTIPYYQEKGLNIGDSVQVNRFASGVNEGCGTGLYLTVDDYVIPRRYSQTLQDVISTPSLNSINYENLAENGVRTWEFYMAANPEKYKIKHRRRYGLTPQPLFLYGFGPWTITPGARYSVQVKRTVSEVSIRRQAKENELRLPISKRQLVASVSCQYLDSKNNVKFNSIMNAPRKPVILFWTPDYWYRPRSARDVYEELQKHLKSIKDFHETQLKRKRRKCNRKFLRKFYNTHREVKDTDEDSNDEPYCKRSRKRKSGFIYNMFSNRIDEIVDAEAKRKPQETSLQYIKRILRLEINLSVWDFDSTTLAEQLTMIDRELFLKISTAELEVLTWQQSAKNAPNLTAMVAFSHRISCLIATEILKDDSERTRSRLLARFINVAEKCHKISNFQSCRTVLNGLQIPAIFRLRKTWAYMRKKHSSKYQSFEYLCRLYRDPRLPAFQKTFYIISHSTPYLPYIGDIAAKLLNKIPEYKIQTLRRPISRQLSFSTTKSSRSRSIETIHQEEHNNLFTKLLKVFTSTEPAIKVNQVKLKKSKKRRPIHRKVIRFKGLYEYFKPLNCYEDCRVECLEETVKFLEKSQLSAMNYNFSVNELARNYLLKARYKEEKENFYNSVRLESPRNYYQYNV